MHKRFISELVDLIQIELNIYFEYKVEILKNIYSDKLLHIRSNTKFCN